MFISGSNSNIAILTAPPRMIPGSLLIENLDLLLSKLNIYRVSFNSIFIAITYSIIALLIYSMAGFALAKYKFKGKGIIFGFIMGSMMIPAQILYVPLFRMMISINMTNSYQAVIFPLLANAFGVFLMKQNMMAFPSAILEAGRIDGLNDYKLFFRLVLPNIKPALSALLIYMFTSIWNNFMWPLIILGSKKMYTFPVALAMLDANPTNKNYAVILLASSMATIPILFVFVVFQKQFVAGVMGGSVKE
jgi:lactose/L-arabinose transport system permease protein